MPLTTEEYCDRVVRSGLMGAGELAKFRDSLPPEKRGADGQALARELVAAKELTKYQAAAVYQGKTKGLVLGNYVVLDKIGAGGMGQVFKAVHRRMERVVAVKVLPATMMSADVLQRFQREAKAAARLEHPNIVAAYDADVSGGVHFLVMQFVDGRDLASLIKEQHRFSEREAVDCVLQTARGLAYAHEHGIIHRDIKPANLLLDKSGVVKILDMGLARLDDNIGAVEDTSRGGLTKSGQIMGTVDYMSPEQAEDTRLADARSDIYSLGCTLYALLTGKPMFTADTAMRKLLAHRTTEIPSLVAARPEISPALDAVYRRMVAKAPAARQQSMAEVISDLEQCQAAAQGPAVLPAVAATYAPPENLSSLDLLRKLPAESASGAPSEMALATPLEKSAQPQVQAAAVQVASRATAGRRSKSSLTIVAIVGGGALGLVLVVALAYLAFGPGNSSQTAKAKNRVDASNVQVRPEGVKPTKSPVTESAQPTSPITSPKSDAETLPADFRSAWLNESYSSTIRQRENAEWHELDNNPARLRFRYKEVARTREYVELLGSDGGDSIRLYASKAEIIKNGQWEWVANGKWLGSPNEGSTVSRTHLFNNPSLPAKTTAKVFCNNVHPDGHVTLEEVPAPATRVWSIKDGELLLTSSGMANNSVLELPAEFSRIQETRFKARTVPATKSSLRIACGNVYVILNWEIANENHILINGRRTSQSSPHALTPGVSHVVSLKQDGATVKVLVDGRAVLEGNGKLEGVVRVGSSETGTVGLREIEIVGLPAKQENELNQTPEEKPALTVKSEPVPPEPAPAEPPPTPKPVAVAADKRWPIPDEAEQKAAQDLARELYAKQIEAAKDPKTKAALAKKLLEDGLATKDDRLGQYVLLQLAGQWATRANDFETAFRTADELGKLFQVEPLEIKSKVASAVAAASRTTAEDRSFAIGMGALAAEALGMDRADLAADLAAFSLAAARKAKDAPLLKQAVERAKQMEAARAAFLRVEKALAVLKERPDDPDANQTVGAYRCFTKGDWAAGLPLLVKGTDDQLQALAAKDLARAAEPDAQVAVADGWWDVAEKHAGPEKLRIQGRARYWYQQAMPKLTGLAKAKVEKRLKEIGEVAPAVLAWRSAAARKALVAAGGGTAGSEEAVEKGLKWFANHQYPDGGWSFDHRRSACASRCDSSGDMPDARNAATGLALLPFLGAGQTHKEGPYKDTVSRGLLYLTSNIKGKNNGATASFEESGGSMYTHGICSIALCEAYAMTHDKQLMAPAQLALNHIVYAQDPAGGGWRYAAKQPGDTSAFGWQLMALKSGHMAYLNVPPETVRGAIKFLDVVQAENGAKYGYTGPGAGQATTAIGLLSRMYLGWKQDNPALQKGVDYLAATGPSTGNMYYNYYATQVMRQHESDDSPAWKTWNEKLRDSLVGSQTKVGHAEGSWYIAGDHGSTHGGRTYCTSMATLMLEVYYRHTPIYGNPAAKE